MDRSKRNVRRQSWSRAFYSEWLRPVWCQYCTCLTVHPDSWNLLPDVEIRAMRVLLLLSVSDAFGCVEVLQFALPAQGGIISCFLLKGQ